MPLPPPGGTRRAASLISLEHYRRAGVLADHGVCS
jgi:hypothetical protein